jgi:hypothetical protein
MGIESLGCWVIKPPVCIFRGYRKLSEAVRLNPDNEAAKYNLELLEKVQAIYSRQGAQL